MNEGKLFIDGKSRPITVTGQAIEARHAMEIALPAVTVESGDDTITVARERVLSLVQTPEVEINPAFLVGKGVTFYGYTSYVARGINPLIQLKDSHAADVVVVIGEDLASSEILLYNLATESVEFVNPAEPEESIALYIRVIRLLAQADALMLEANGPVGPDPDYGDVTEDEANALAHLERGDTAAAEAIAGPEFVGKVIQEGGGRPMPEPRTPDEVGKDSLPE